MSEVDSDDDASSNVVDSSDEDDVEQGPLDESQLEGGAMADSTLEESQLLEESELADESEGVCKYAVLQISCIMFVLDFF